MIAKLITLFAIFLLTTAALNWSNSGERVDLIEKRVAALEARTDSLRVRLVEVEDSLYHRGKL